MAFNGNLLLNIGPKADGTLSELDEERLVGIGKWMSVNGEAIYGTKPCAITMESSIKVRYPPLFLSPRSLCPLSLVYLLFSHRDLLK